MSTVNLAEVVSHLVFNGMPIEEAEATLSQLPFIAVPADRALAVAAGRLRPATAAAGLSLADRFCLALAEREGATAWTADRQWARIAPSLRIVVHMIR